MGSSLETYNAKRDFRKTPEPSGKKRDAQVKLLFVIQRHAASHLHFDFRLELNGVLKSWAVPKEPSMDPKIKRLAVQVEDHPIEYASFQGDIPPGQYGAGHVEIWDQGEWFPLDSDPHLAWEKGHLKFELRGKKLKGRWALIRTKSLKKNDWLLIKKRDE